MNKKVLYFDKEWFVFPLAISWHDQVYELVGRYSRLEIHFLWWHWRWFIKRKEK